MAETETEELGEMPITVSANPGAHVPAVVIVPSIFGVPTDLVAQMEEIADRGAWVAAMDPFYRERPGPWSYADPAGAVERMKKTDLEAVYADFLKLVKHAKKQGNGKVIGLGICFGGPFCFKAAGEGKLDAIVTWHGSRLEEYVDEVEGKAIPLRLHFGDADPVVPMKSVRKIKSALKGHDDAEVLVHEGATHGFSHRQSKSHDIAAEKAGMESVKELLRFAGSPL